MIHLFLSRAWEEGEMLQVVLWLLNWLLAASLLGRLLMWCGQTNFHGVTLRERGDCPTEEHCKMDDIG